jgi:hypothetical protein
VECHSRNKKKVGQLEQNDEKRNQAEQQLEIDKVTPPDFETNLYIQDSTIGVLIILNNNIPFQFRFTFSGLKPVAQGLITHSPFTNLYPTKRIWFFVENQFNKYFRPDSGTATVTLKFEYYSMYFDYTRDPKLAGVINKNYQLDWDKRTLTEIK